MSPTTNTVPQILDIGIKALHINFQILQLYDDDDTLYTTIHIKWVLFVDVKENHQAILFTTKLLDAYNH